MTKEELLTDIEAFLKDHEQSESAGRVDGEDAIGVEFHDGTQYFIEVQDA